MQPKKISKSKIKSIHLYHDKAKKKNSQNAWIQKSKIKQNVRFENPYLSYENTLNRSGKKRYYVPWRRHIDYLNPHLNTGNQNTEIIHNKTIINTATFSHLRRPIPKSSVKPLLSSNNADQKMNTQNLANLVQSFVYYYYKNYLSHYSHIRIFFIKVKYPFMDPALFSKLLGVTADYLKSKNIAKAVSDKLTLCINQPLWDKNRLFLNNDYTSKIGKLPFYLNIKMLPSYIKGIKIIIEGRTSFINLSSRQTKYYFIWGSLNQTGKTYYDRSQILNNKGYFSIKVWISVI